VSKERPLRASEVVEESHALGKDPLVDKTWIVQPLHFGHTMTVLGRIVDVEGALRFQTGMYLVRCSCGEEFRMAKETIYRKLSVDDAANH
jgi:hypothetical protein